jgi:hypothetical protein
LPFHQFFTNAGAVLNGGTLTFYRAGTSTLLDTYSDVDLTTANSNPITLDAYGRTTTAIFFSAASYKVILKDSSGSTIATRDNVAAVPNTNVDLDIQGTAGEALSANDVCYPSDGSNSLVPGRYYKTSSDNLYSSVDAGEVLIAVTAIASGASGSFRKEGRVTGMSGLSAGSKYFISSTSGGVTATAPANARYVGTAESSTVLIFNPSAAFPAINTPCDGRLTLTTGTPVTTADVTAATTLYFAPYAGNRLALYDGSRWRAYALSQVSIAVPSTTSQLYDVFIYDSSGTLTLELTAWTNDTTRATNLTTQDGVLVKTGATTRRYLGSFRTTAVSGQTEDSKAKRYLWNYYHRIKRLISVKEATNSWTYTTATYRQANNSAANQADVVVGWAEVLLSLELKAHWAATGAIEYPSVTFGEDAITASSDAFASTAGLTGSSASISFVGATLEKYPAVGRHYYPWLEYSTNNAGGGGAGTMNWYGDNNTATTLQSGITGWIEG